MRTNSDQANETTPLRLAEPDLAAWAEQIAVKSAGGRSVWYGAALFWLVIACILTARVMFLDVSKLQPATATVAAPSVVAGTASQAPHDARL
jgi:hypothetical protein